MNLSDIRLVIGLGNPGDEYDKTRHNVGFEVIDHLLGSVKKKDAPVHRCTSMVDNIRFASRQVFLQKPLTYMNLSGEAVSCLCRKETILPEQILVVYDCLDLPVGKIRLRKKGSSGGQKGIQNIIDILQDDKIKRIRIGIAPFNGREDDDTKDFVLSTFRGEERMVMDRTVAGAAEAVKKSLLGRFDQAMNEFNKRDFKAETEAELAEESDKQKISE